MIKQLKGKYEVLNDERADSENIANSFNLKFERAEKDDVFKLWFDSEDRNPAYIVMHLGTEVVRRPATMQSGEFSIPTDELALTVHAASDILFTVSAKDGIPNGWNIGHDIGRSILVCNHMGNRSAILPNDNPYKNFEFDFCKIAAKSASTLRLNPEPSGKYLVHIGLLFDDENKSGTIVLHQHMLEDDAPQLRHWFGLAAGRVMFLGTLAFGGELGLHTRWLMPNREFGDDIKALGQPQGIGEFFAMLFGKDFVKQMADEITR